MICSQDIDPHQLIIFVQSFGIPPANMSLLWREVDKFTQQDSSAVEQVRDVYDRPMQQLCVLCVFF